MSSLATSGPVVLGGVDVVHAGLHGAPKHGDGLTPVARRSHDPGSGELHRPEADPSYGELAEQEGVHGDDPKPGSAETTPVPTR